MDPGTKERRWAGAQTLRRIPTVCFAILFFSSASVPQTDAVIDEVLRESAKFAAIYAAVEQHHCEEVDPDKAIWDGGIRGMLATLDPFSAFFDREQFQMLQQQTRGEAKGFGSILYVQPGKILILQTAQGSPSWRAGLGPGDEIVAINGTRVDRLDFESLVRLLQRSRSQSVSLSVVRLGKVVAQEFKLQPAEVAVPTVDRSFLFSPGVGYVHVSGFEMKTPKEMEEALTRLGGRDLKGLRGLLLDLRDNHGGMLEAAIGVISLFLKPDLVVFTVRGRAVPEKSSRTTAAGFRYDGPLVVLVNGNTASAGEIVAAALQEHDRAVIAGEPTFGKGVVQTVMPLSEETALALTTAQYFTPSGRSIQRPLPGTVLTSPQGHIKPVVAGPAVFRTQNGRTITAGGGVTPDVTIASRSLDPWVMFLNQQGFFTSFASDYLAAHKVDASFEPDDKLLEQFKDLLVQSRIRVHEEYWKQDQPYLKLRIKTEMLNLVYGLARGDEVEVRADPQVQKAANLLPRFANLLKPSAANAGMMRADRHGKR